MVKSSKKVLAVLLAVACLITFMPAMASQSYAASKKAVKVTGTKTITAGKTTTLKASQKVKWTIKSGKKVVKLSSKKSKSVKVKGLKKGTAKVTATPATKALKKSYKAKTVTIKVKAKKAVKPEEKLAISSAKQTGEKTIDVTFNKEVDDTLAFKVARGNIDTTVSQTVISSDKKTVTLTLANKIQAADYTITATPTEGDALTATVKGEVSTLSEIKFMSDKLAVKSNTELTEGYVTVKGYDQFGTEVAITGATWNTSSSSTAPTLSGNVLTVKATGNFVLGQQVVVSVVYANSTKVANATLTVSNAAYASKFTFGEVATTNTKLQGKDITVSNLADDSYYIPVTVEDQYGNTLTADQLNAAVSGSQLFVTSANPTVASVGSFKTVDKKTVLEVKKPASTTALAGEAVINFVSIGGTTAQAKFTVVDDSKIDSVTIGSVGTVAAGQYVDLPTTITDQKGNTVNLYDKTIKNGANDSSSITLDDGTQITVSNGKVKLVKDYSAKTGKLQVSATSKGTVVVTIISATYKVSNANFTAGDAAVVSGIKGLNSKVSTTLEAGQSVTLTKDSFDYVDQYGNDVKTSDVKADKTLSLEFPTENGTYTTISSGKITAGAKAGTDTYNVKLVKTDSKTQKTTTIDNIDVQVKVVANDDIAYTVKSLGTLQVTGSADSYTSESKTVEVEGTVDGKSVTVNQSDIKSVTASTDDITVTKGADGTYTLAIAPKASLTDTTPSKTAKIYVLLETENGTKTLESDLTYTKAASAANSVVVTDSEGKTATQLEISKNDLTSGVLLTAKSTSDAPCISFYVADQYGEPISSATYTATNLPTHGTTKATVAVAADGKLSATGVESGDTFNLTVAKNGVSKTVVIVVGE